MREVRFVRGVESFTSANGSRPRRWPRRRVVCERGFDHAERIALKPRLARSSGSGSCRLRRVPRRATMRCRPGQERTSLGIDEVSPVLGEDQWEHRRRWCAVAR